MNPALENRFYYLDNFRFALDWVGRRCVGLLDAEERLFLQRFQALPQASSALLVRMVMRQGDWFRGGKLRYEEIGDPQAAARPLLDFAWIDDQAPIGLEQLFALLRKEELCAAFGLPPRQAGARKDALLADLLPRFPDPRPFTAWVGAGSESVYRLQVRPMCERFRLMFFGNLHQDWSEFVLADLGIHRYESVPFSASSRGFQPGLPKPGRD